jgi:hypothetical protein
VTQATAPNTAASNYTGPAAANADTASFQVNLWNNIRTADKCGGCHHEGGQDPQFARSDDVNLAYQAASALVNFQNPSQSELVLQVGSGHNCWVADPSACATTMTQWITAWAGASAGSSTSVQLTAPTSTDVAGGKQFPATAETEGSSPPDSFKETVYPLLSQFCSGCHQPNSASAQTPYFAQADVDAAYAAAQSKMDLNTPANSRFVVRLGSEHHNCWTTPSGGPADCAGSSAAMQAAIQKLADGIAVTSVDASLITSKGLHLTDGTVASGGSRSEANLIAKYEFKTGTGQTAYDTSGVSPEADLMLTGDFGWVSGWGISLNTNAGGGKAFATTAASAKITSAVQASGEYSIEAWVAPSNVTQTNAWIVTYSGSDTTRNMTLGQHAMQYQGDTRSDQTDPNGQPPLLTLAANMNAQAALQHVVLTYDAVNGQQIYVNGVFTGDKDPKKGGSLASWDNTFALVLGSEVTGKEQWAGVVKMVAIHSRALTATQVMQNFNAGVGEKYFLLFDIADVSGVSQAYIEMTATILDTYAYQFSNPTFVSLNPNAAPANLPLKGIRIGVNGVEQPTGQSYATVNATIGGTAYTAASGQLLSKVGAVVASNLGPDGDVFFLDFDQLGSKTHVHSDPASAVPAVTYPAVAPASFGVKNFAQLNSSFSSITGVPVSNATVNALYNQLQQSLPPTNDISAFLASNQTAVAQLADQYCNIAVMTPAMSTGPAGALFPGVDPTQTAAGTFFANTTNANLVINPLINKAIGAGVNPAAATIVSNELTALFKKLTTTPYAATGTNRVGSIAQAACTSVLGSSVVSLQ